MLYFGQQCFSTYNCFFFLVWVAKDTTNYHVTVIWSCNVASRVISLLADEWGSQLSDCAHHQIDTAPLGTSSLFIHTDAGSPLLDLWYHLQRCTRATVKFHPITTFRHGRMQRIRAWFPYSKGSVNEATDFNPGPGGPAILFEWPPDLPTWLPCHMVSKINTFQGIA